MLLKCKYLIFHCIEKLAKIFSICFHFICIFKKFLIFFQHDHLPNFDQHLATEII